MNFHKNIFFPITVILINAVLGGSVQAQTFQTYSDCYETSNTLWHTVDISAWLASHYAYNGVYLESISEYPSDFDAFIDAKPSGGGFVNGWYLSNPTIYTSTITGYSVMVRDWDSDPFQNLNDADPDNDTHSDCYWLYQDIY